MVLNYKKCDSNAGIVEAADALGKNITNSLSYLTDAVKERGLS